MDDKTPQPIDVRQLIAVPKLSQHAAISAIMAFEIEDAMNGIFPIRFNPLINKIVRFSTDRESHPNNCLVISDISQYSRITLSLFVKKAVLGEDEYDFTVFRQASYSKPNHSFIDIDKFPLEKKGIVDSLTILLEGFTDKKILENEFFNIYYISEDMVNAAISKGATWELIDITGNTSESVPPQPTTEQQPISIDPWNYIPESKKD